jgi:magnesium transporter
MTREKDEKKGRDLFRRRLNGSRRKGSYAEKAGQPPGTLLSFEEEKPVSYEIFDFNSDAFIESRGEGLPSLESLKKRDTLTWLNVTGVENTGLLHYLGQEFDIHQVVLEDIQNTVQRPKIEEYENLIFLTFRMMQWNEDSSEILTEQLSVLIGDSFVISFQERPGDVFDEIRKRIREGRGRVRSAGPDYLGYALLDMVVDNYFLIMEELEEMIEDVEEALVEGYRKEMMPRLQRIRRMLFSVRRAVWPLRDMMNHVQKLEIKRIQPSTHVYFKDLYDHVLRIIDTLELMKDTTASLADSWQTALSNDMNSVMKVLTIIATIFIPLTFIAGIYGMNFQHMPELALPWAYPAALIVMGLLGIVMLVFFKLKKWL